MEEKIQESTINTEQTVHQARVSEAFLDKIKNAFSPTQRKKTIAVIAIIFSVVVLLTVFFSTSNPKNIAQRFAKAYICSDLKTVTKLTAYDYKEFWLGSGYDEETEETFFEEKSDYYSEDITSWNDYYKVIYEYEKEWMEENYGDFNTTSRVTKTKDLSEKKLNEELGKGRLSDLEEMGFDSNKASAYKKITVKIKINGEDDSGRYTVNVYEARIGEFWKVLDCECDWDS